LELIDDCLALAATSGKFIGLSVVAGIKSPPWLMGADTFTDGSTTLNVAGLYSPTASFVAADVGRVIDCDKFPPGTTIISTTRSVATLSAPATATKSGNLTFSILARHPGVPFHVLTAPDSGVMPVPWDPVVLTKWKEFVAALGARYDGNANLLYVPMGGFSQTGESYLATQQADVDYFNASAVAAGLYRDGEFLRWNGGLAGGDEENHRHLHDRIPDNAAFYYCGKTVSKQPRGNQGGECNRSLGCSQVSWQIRNYELPVACDLCTWLFRKCCDL
jgi:hypothetical protein